MAEEGTNQNNGFNISMIIAIVLSVLLATGMSYFMMMRFGGLSTNQEEQTEEEETKKEVQRLGPTHNLEQFLVNLSESNSYVKINIAVEVDKEEVIEEIETRSPQIRDTVISILRSKKIKTIQDNPQAKDLREEIRTAINQYLADGSVTNVFFTEFVVQ
ncbi:MAG: flagellar basal body-associated FliL family protein [Bacillota bacterium]